MPAGPPDVIINFTPTGMIPTNEMTPHVPITPSEIIEQVHEAFEIGITMVHLHAREEESGRPCWQAEVYRKIIEGIRDFTRELIICVSLSGRNYTEFEKRTDVLLLDGELKPDMGSLTLSSVNFNRIASINSPDMVRIAGRRTLPRPAVELKRDEVFYGWRYRNPLKNYTFYYAGYPGEITGFVVVSHKRNNLRGYIVDYGQTEEGSLERILRLIRRRRDFDILSIYEFCVDRSLASCLHAGELRKNRVVRFLEEKRVHPTYPFFLIKTAEGEDGWFWDGLDLRDISNWSMMGTARELE
jgi:hypothetical protein